MSDTADRNAELEAELKETRDQLRKTQAQLENLQGELERASRRSRQLGRWGLRLLAGPELRTSSRAWFARLAELRSPRELVSPESADLFTAIARRVLRIGVFGLVVATFAIFTPLVTLWQSFLIRDQNTTIQRQVEQQAADNLIVRRAQLLATIYEEKCQDSPPAAESAEGEESPAAPAESAEGEESPERACAPRAHVRARQEAVLAFVEIERGNGARPDLRGANLLDANFSRANLIGANLIDADLRGANLLDANLFGADLSIAKNLAQMQINGAEGDLDTQLPESLTRPEHWGAEPTPDPAPE